MIRSHAVSAIVLAALAAGASAQTFNAALDFGTTNNPNGAWSYGRKSAAITDVFKLNTLYSTAIPVGGAWVASTALVPAVGKLSSAQNDAPNGSMYLLPENVSVQDGLAVLRWTAPSAGEVSINGLFYAGSGGTTDNHVVRNGVSLLTASNTSVATPFALTAGVAAGDTIEFIVGPAGTPSNDLTPLSATIVLAPVPEPTTMAALGLGAVALLRRRKK